MVEQLLSIKILAAWQISHGTSGCDELFDDWHTVLICHSGHARDFPEILDWLLSNPEQILRFGSAVRNAAVEKYSRPSLLDHIGVDLC
jgi:hypothetical protein